MLTDQEIVAVMRDGNNCNYNDEAEHIDFARAVIAAHEAKAAPAEPFGYFRADAMGWTDCAADDEGAIALYERPASPAVSEGEPVATVTECTRSHPHELMSPECKLRTEIARLTNENERLKRAAPAPAVPQGWVKASDRVPLESDGEVFIRFTDGSIGTGWATYWHGASNGFAQWTFPDPDEDRTVLEWAKNPAALREKEGK